MADNPMTPMPNEDPIHVAQNCMAFMLSVIRCGEQLSEDEVSTVRKAMNGLSALKQPRTQWQPIETAPKDQMILGYRMRYGDHVHYAGRWDGVSFTPHPLGPYAPSYTDFTHWMALPEPPEASREARMAADGITEEDIAETMPPKPEDAR